MKKIFLCLFMLVFIFNAVKAQNVIEFSNNSGIALEDYQITALEEIASKTIPSFSDGNYKLFDASFYTFNDEMGDVTEASVWESYKNKAKSLSPNYLLLGRQYFAGTGGFKLWIHLEIEVEDLECYSDDDKSKIVEYITASQQELIEWYEYLSFKPETNGFEIVEQVAELGYYKLDKVCCELDASRNGCSADRLDPKQIEDEKNLKYFILGRLRCLFDVHDCVNPIDVSNDNGLNALVESSFKETENSQFWQSSDILERIGFMHIYISDQHTNTVSCNVIPDETQTRNWYVENDNVNEIEVKVYDLGKFTIVIKREADLFEILESISVELTSDLGNVVVGLAENEPIDENFLDLLKFASKCDFLSLLEPEKYNLLKLIVSEGSASWYEFWRWFVEQYPIFIRQLYDAIGTDDGSGYLNKKLFFEYQGKSGNIGFANDLLSYDFPDEIKKGFLKDYCIDYQRSCFHIGGDPMVITINEVEIDSIIYLPYEVNKFLNFYNANLNFKFNGQSGNIDIKKKLQFPEFHGNSTGTSTAWVSLYSEKPFNPICLTQINIDEFKALSGVLPAIILPRIQEYIDDENFFNGIMLAVDAASTLTVIGNVGKLRHIGKVNLFFTGVEITATLGNNLITYTILIADPNLKKRVSIFLAVVEMAAAIGNGLTPSDIKHIQDKGIDLAKALDYHPTIEPKLSAGIRLICGGKANLLERISELVGEQHDLYKFVLAIDESVDALKITRLNALSKGALLKVASELKITSKISKFTDDLAYSDKGLELVMYFNVKPGCIKAWKTLFDFSTLRINQLKLKAVDDFATAKNIDQSLIKTELDNLPTGYKEDLIKGFEVSNGTTPYPQIANKGDISTTGSLHGSFQNGQFVPNGNTQPNGIMDFVALPDRQILLGTKHTFLSQGADVLGAGTVKLNNGVIKDITNLSGHYVPTPREGMNFLRVFKEQGVNIDNAFLSMYKADGTILKQVAPSANVRKLYE